MKEWELVQWDRRSFAVGVKLVRDNLDVVTEAGSPSEVRWFMKKMAGWNPEPVRVTHYDVRRATRTDWDGRRDH